MHGGDLFDRLVKKKSYTEQETRIVVKNIVKAVHYIHERGLVHRGEWPFITLDQFIVLIRSFEDLKPENLLLENFHDDVTVKIADFGFAKNLEEGNLLTTPCGSPGYVAPEIANEQAYTTGVDMWSIGIIMYTLLVSNILMIKLFFIIS